MINPFRHWEDVLSGSLSNCACAETGTNTTCGSYWKSCYNNFKIIVEQAACLASCEQFYSFEKFGTWFEWGLQRTTSSPPETLDWFRLGLEIQQSLNRVQWGHYMFSMKEREKRAGFLVPWNGINPFKSSQTSSSQIQRSRLLKIITYLQLYNSQSMSTHILTWIYKISCQRGSR